MASDDIEDIGLGNRRFRETFEADEDFYRRLADERQRPKFLYIGCSDSRVVPQLMTGANAGDLFVIRNIANIVPPAHSGDDSVGAAIEYCVRYLDVDDIVVCGHTRCGGIAALGGQIPESDPHLGRWVEFARLADELVRVAHVPEDQRLTESVKANILFQQDNLKTYDCVREAVAEGRLRLHGWLYEMSTGDLLAYDARDGAWHKLGE